MPPFGRLAYMSHMIHKRFMNKHGIELRIISQLSPRSGDKGNTWLTAALANHLLRITWQPFVFQTISMMRNGSIFLHIICRKSPPTAWQSYFLSQLFNLRLLCKFSLNHSLQLAHRVFVVSSVWWVMEVFFKNSSVSQMSQITSFYLAINFFVLIIQS